MGGERYMESVNGRSEGGWMVQENLHSHLGLEGGGEGVKSHEQHYIATLHMKRTEA